MRIVNIKTNPLTNEKLVAAQKLLDNNFYLPIKDVFFDYKDGLLKEFAGNSYKPTIHADFKAALKHIQSL